MRLREVFLIGLFQPYDTHQYQAHVQELIQIGRLLEKIYLRQPGADKGQPHPGGKSGGGGYLFHGHGKKEDIAQPKNDIAGKRHQYLPMLPVGKKGRPPNGPQPWHAHELQAKCPADLEQGCDPQVYPGHEMYFYYPHALSIAGPFSLSDDIS